MSEHYIVRWKQVDAKWKHGMTRKEADKALANDIAYFYNDIEIQLVKVTEEVVSSHFGSHERRRA